MIRIYNKDIRFEPSLALIADGNGLSALQIIIEQAFSKLDYNGILLIEHGYDQKQTVRSMLNQYGYESIETWQDMQGIDRVSGGRRGR